MDSYIDKVREGKTSEDPVECVLASLAMTVVAVAAFAAPADGLPTRIFLILVGVVAAAGALFCFWLAGVADSGQRRRATIEKLDKESRLWEQQQTIEKLRKQLADK